MAGNVVALLEWVEASPELRGEVTSLLSGVVVRLMNEEAERGEEPSDRYATFNAARSLLWYLAEETNIATLATEYDAAKQHYREPVMEQAVEDAKKPRCVHCGRVMTTERTIVAGGESTPVRSICSNERCLSRRSTVQRGDGRTAATFWLYNGWEPKPFDHYQIRWKGRTTEWPYRAIHGQRKTSEDTMLDDVAAVLREVPGAREVDVVGFGHRVGSSHHLVLGFHRYVDTGLIAANVPTSFYTGQRKRRF